MSFNKVNNLTGWVTCLTACTVYLLTMEPTASLWDCGEFISSAYKLQVPHPPGAPLFLLMGRFFVILFGDDPQSAARAVNSMSAIASGFTILFLFWSITHFARKLTQNNGTLNKSQVFTIMSAGVIGALAYTFSDSFWYSAVEGEVYALSSFFTALVFWSILKWEQQADRPGADRWLIFIFFIMGLSIGVHLLNLLTIPALVMVYYFKRFKVTLKGTILAFVIGCAIFGFVQKFIVAFTINGAGWFDIQFVNNLGLPFFTGFTVFFLLVALLLIIGIRYANKRKLYYLRIGLWGTVFMLLGYSTYLTTIIRSNANPGVDMFNVDNPISLSGYLGREQYGDWPILYGPDFTDPAPFKADGDLLVKGKHRYEVAGKNYKQDWVSAPSSHFFPRMWNSNNDRQALDCYRRYTGLEEGESPSLGDNIKYFAKYQAGWMYMRYFLWNFAGRQNDLQGYGNPRDSNFISGISFVDNALYGDQSKMPDSIRTGNKAYNKLYMLPLALGLAGLFFHLKRNRKDFIVNGLLFLCTGMGIVFYLNQSGYEPRERDYIFVGSFYAFAVWIGLGVIWVKELLEKWIKSPVAMYAASGLCLLAVPVLMAQQEWDDHDRSHKTLARDLAKDFLESCPPNAILFSFEDNDTYPLWYAQEVEGIRPDVRVVVNTLLGSDWFMNQLRYKINESAPFDIIFTPEQVQGNKLNVAYYSNVPGFDQNKYYDLHHVLKNMVGSNDPKYTSQGEDGEAYNLLPVRKFSVPVNMNTVKRNGAVLPGDSVVNELRLDLTHKNFIFKNDLAILAVIAANEWKRPICFTSPRSLRDLDLEKYTRMEGLAYRLVPVENGGVNNAMAYKNIMEKFEYGNAAGKDVYFDQDNRRYLNAIQSAHLELAMSLIKAGDKEAARKVLTRFDEKVNASNFPYGATTNRGNDHNYTSVQFLQACYLSDHFTLAKKVAASLKKDLKQQLAYYNALGDEPANDETLATHAYLLLQGKGSNLADRQMTFAQDILSSFQLLQQMQEWEKQFQQKTAAL
jgi:hypothetical protein